MRFQKYYFFTKNTIWKFVLCMVLYFLFSVNIDVNAEVLFSVPDRISEFLYLAVFYMLIEWRSTCNDKRLKNISNVVGGILAFCYVLGYNIEKNLELFTETTEWFRFPMKWISIAWILSTIILWCYLLLSKTNEKNLLTGQMFGHGIKCYFCTVLLFVISWLPSIIKNFPGVLIGDSYNVIYQAIGVEKLSTHHPLVYTLIVRLCMLVGENIDSGIALGMLFSVAMCIFLLSYIVYYMISRKWDDKIILFTFAFFMFYPSFKMFAITINKDMIFAAFVGVFICALIEMITTELSTRQKWILSLSAFGVILFRKNGLYLVLFTLAAMILVKCNRKNKFFCFVALISAVLINSAIEGPIRNYFKISEGSPREMLSLPLQQMARIVKNEKFLKEAEREKIFYYFKDDTDLATLYDPIISDNVKGRLNEKNYKDHEKDFLKLTMQLLSEYPEESIEAYLCQSFGYWYPTAINWFYAENNKDHMTYNSIIKNHEYAYSVNYVKQEDVKYLPVLYNLTCIAFVFWAFIALIGYFIYLKKYQWLMLFAPMFALWLTSVASPVWNEQRYILAIYIVLPEIIGLAIKYKPENTDKGKSKQTDF